MRENKEGTDYGLRLMAEVLKTEHLHWGYFPDKKFKEEAMTLTGLKEAQLEYTKNLFLFIPGTVRSILDVGAGLGKTAYLLTKNGYQVSCLSNDKYQQTTINQKYPAIPFIKSKFEDSRLNQTFDLVLMSESVQYLNWPRTLNKLEEVLKPGGFLLTSDYFRKTDNLFYKTCKVRESFEIANKNKFDLIKEEDITDNVLPTLDFAMYSFDNYILPAANIAGEAISNSTPPLVKYLANIFLKKQLQKAHYYIWEHTPEKFDREKFKQEMNYIIQLWRRK
jgi:MPBQ/MSBQ methyltransferase